MSQVQTNAMPPSRKQIQPKRSFGNFARKAFLIGSLALASVSVLNAQVKQVYTARDSTNPHIKEVLYGYDKYYNPIKKSAIELVWGFEVFIPKNPKNELKINDDIILTIAEQRALRSGEALFVENNTYVFHYLPPRYYDSILVYRGCLTVFKKKQPAKQPEETMPKLFFFA